MESIYDADTDSMYSYDDDDNKDDGDNSIDCIKDDVLGSLDGSIDELMRSIDMMQYGDEINFCFKRLIRCNIKKNIRFDSYIFRGRGCKNILRYYIDKHQSPVSQQYKGVVQILDDVGHRQFIMMRSWDDLWDRYRDELLSDRKLFEVILSDRPCKPYLDIEWLSNSKHSIKSIEDNFVKKIAIDLKRIFSHRYGIAIEDDNLMITTSHKISGSTKLSFHMVIDCRDNGYHLVYRTNRKGYTDSAWDLCVALIESDPKYYEKKIDQSVYTLDREFRTLYSNKHNEYRPFIPLGLTLPNKSMPLRKGKCFCLSYLITSYSSNLKFITTPIININYYKKPLNVQWDPFFYSDKKVMHYIDLLKPVHPSAYFTGESNGKYRFSYHNKNELCYTGNKHDSNGFYVSENDRFISMKCLSSNCKKKYILKKKKDNDTILLFGNKSKR